LPLTVKQEKELLKVYQFLLRWNYFYLWRKKGYKTPPTNDELKAARAARKKYYFNEIVELESSVPKLGSAIWGMAHSHTNFMSLMIP
jgi:hypothetical protein